ncbi:MAG: hypothetical protein HY323_12955 [Betaproteobacteria bacterium]|nr:hypothetical protein [Betaproteobacteria bacterium]
MRKRLLGIVALVLLGISLAGCAGYQAKQGSALQSSVASFPSSSDD